MSLSVEGRTLRTGCDCAGVSSRASGLLVTARDKFRPGQDKDARKAEALKLKGKAMKLSAEGRYNEALAYLERALEMVREIGYRTEEAILLNDVGVTELNLNRLDLASEHFKQALDIFGEIPNRRQEGRTLANLGGVFYQRGQYQKAEEYYQKALSIAREVNDSENQAGLLNNIGLINDSLGHYEVALKNYQESRELMSKLKMKEEEGDVLNNIGLVYYVLGDNAEAIRSLKRSLEISRRLKNRSSEGTSLNNLGLVSYGAGEIKKALDYYNQAMAAFKEADNKREEASVHNNLGMLFDDLGQYEKSKESYEQAVALARESDNPDTEGVALSNLGSAYQRLARYDVAAEKYLQSLVILRAVGNRMVEATTFSNLMVVSEKLGHRATAVFYGKQAVEIYQQVRTNIRALKKELQQSFLRSKADEYRFLANLLINQGRLPEAQQVLDLLKHEEFLEFVRGEGSRGPEVAGAVDLTAAEAEWRKGYEKVAEQAAATSRSYGELLAKRPRSAEEEQHLKELYTQLVSSTKAFEDFFSLLTAKFKSSQPEKLGEVKNSKALMADLKDLGEGVVALYTLSWEDKYRVILITPNVEIVRDYPIAANSLNRKIYNFRRVLQDPQQDPLQLAKELYQIVVGPVAKDLAQAGATTLMWSLDGALRYLPVAALHDGEKYMAERFRNVIFTPASNARLKDVPDSNRRALGLGVSEAKPNFIALPNVRKELYEIIRVEGSGGLQTGIIAGEVKLDGEFNEDSMDTALRKGYQVVHIASHFKLQPGDSQKSYLLLGDGQQLTLSRLDSKPNIFGGVELLTLSACNTAVGIEAAEGGEVEGLGVMAQLKGAKSVVASLWAVSDESTRLLMKQFYEGLQTGSGRTKAEALRGAQMALLHGQVKGANGQTYVHPYYWAPFILIGNWR